METLLSDLRYAVRVLVQKPALAILAIATLAVGIGANTAIFSVVDGVVLRPLPYPEPEELVMVWQDHTRSDGPPTEWVSPDNFFDWRDQNSVFESIFVVDSWGPTLSGIDRPEQLKGAVVSHDALAQLGYEPVLGRSFTPDEDVADGPKVVLLSHGLWTSRFGADRGILGASVVVDGESATVIGVLSEATDLPIVGAPDIVGPLQIDATNSCGRGCVSIRVVARLADGVSLSHARSEMETIAARLERDFPDENQGVGVNLVPLHEDVVGPMREGLFLLLGAVGLVLLIACANVASLMLTRAADRSKEVATRVAIGASRARLFRQMLTESVVLSLLGSLAGLVVALWGVWFLQSMVPGSVPRFEEVSIDVRAFAFTLVIGVLTGVAFGLIPALRASRPDLTGSLKAGGLRGGAGVSSARFRSALVIGEVAVALALMIGAGLLMRSFQALMDVDPGFATDNVLTGQIGLVGAAYEDASQRVSFVDRLQERVAALPGVEAAGVIFVLPMGGANADAGFRIEGRPEPPPSQGPVAWYRPATPEYFDTMRVGLVSGRKFTPADDREANPVVLINEAAAMRYWSGEDPLLSSVRIGGAVRRVVGVVADTKHFGLDSSERPAMYFPFDQLAMNQLALVVRSAGEPETIATAVRDVVWEIDPELAIANLRPMRDIVAGTVVRPRMIAALLAVFAGVAMTLAAIGLYGVMSFMVRSRTHEIGIRMALGASARDVLTGAVGRGMFLMGIGTAAGLVLSLFLNRLLQGFLFGVSSTDLVSFATGPLVLAVVALLACYIPARRAAGVDPVIALRHE